VVEKNDAYWNYGPVDTVELTYTLKPRGSGGLLRAKIGTKIINAAIQVNTPDMFFAVFFLF
jgi:hypothetical protein